MADPRQTLYCVICCIAAGVPAGWGQVQGTATERLPPSFSTTTDLVPVTVVVRNRDGNAVGRLEKTDFELRDNGKTQTILQFSVNKSAPIIPSEAAVSTDPLGNEHAVLRLPAVGPVVEIPQRFIAYVFDDVHTDIADLIRARAEAAKHMERVLEATRVGVFTVSGRMRLEFTRDFEQVRKTIESIRHGNTDDGFADCPPLNYFWADLILKNDSEAIGAAILETIACRGGTLSRATAEGMVRASAIYQAARGQHESGMGLNTLDDIVRRLSDMPGSRSIVYVSSGFLVDKDLRFTQNRVFENAIRANVVINSLDARGLYAVTPGGRADNFAKTPSSQAVINFRERMNREVPLAISNVMAEFASATGGKFIWNSNDYQAGYEELAGAPENTYVLWFSPGVKSDGKYHKLRVTLKNSKGLKVSARTGYYAPNPEVTR